MGCDRDELKNKLLSKYGHLGLSPEDIEDSLLTFDDYLIGELNTRDKIISTLCDAIKKGKSISDKVVEETIEEYNLLIA